MLITWIRGWRARVFQANNDLMTTTITNTHCFSLSLSSCDASMFALECINEWAILCPIEYLPWTTNSVCSWLERRKKTFNDDERAGNLSSLFPIYMSTQNRHRHTHTYTYTYTQAKHMQSDRKWVRKIIIESTSTAFFIERMKERKKAKNDEKEANKKDKHSHIHNLCILGTLAIVWCRKREREREMWCLLRIC